LDLMYLALSPKYLNPALSITRIHTHGRRQNFFQGSLFAWKKLTTF